MDGGDERREDGPEPTPDEVLARLGAELASAVTAAVPAWVERSVTGLVRAWSGAVDAEVVAAARAAGREAADEVGPDLARLLAADVDDQWTNPLAIVRRAVGPATAALRAAGVGEVRRDPDDEARFPDDVYDLTPRTFADLDPGLHEPGLIWGAVKARAHLARHRPAGAGPS